MKFNLKATGIVLAAVVTTLATINGIVRAEDNQIQNQSLLRSNQLGCQTQFVKEFTHIPVVINTTGQTLRTAQVIKVTSYLNGKLHRTLQSVTLSKLLAPQGSTSLPQIQLQGNGSFTCEAIYTN